MILREKNLEKHLYNLINEKYIINYKNNLKSHYYSHPYLVYLLNI